jgi:hypothetical protein
VKRVRVTTKGFRDLERRVRKLCDGQHVKIGVLASSGGGEASDEGDGDLTVAEVAQLHEYGEGDLQERSFIRATLRAREAEIGALVARLTGPALEGKITPERVLDLVGGYCAGEIKRFIASNQVKPPTGEAARIAKNRRAGKADGAASVTLVDRGQLYNAVSHEVVPK